MCVSQILYLVAIISQVKIVSLSYIPIICSEVVSYLNAKIFVLQLL